MAAGTPPMAGRVSGPPMPGPGAPPLTAAPRPQTAPAPASTGMYGEAPPVQVKPVINVAARYREIGTIRLFAIVFMITCALLSMVDSVLNVGITPMSLVGLVLTVMAIITGFIAILNQKNRKLNNIMSLLSVSMMIAGAAARPAILFIGRMSLTQVDFILSLMFAIFFLLYLEYMHAVRRFWEIGEMAIDKNLKEFDFGHVLRQYMAMGFVWLVVVIILSIGVVGLQFVLQSQLPPQFGQSAEMNSVYGLAIAEGMIFVVLAVILSMILGRKEYAQSFRSGMTSVRREPKKPAPPTSAVIYDIKAGAPAQTGLSATAPPPRAR